MTYKFADGGDDDQVFLMPPAGAQVLLWLPLGDYEPPAGYGVIFRQGSVQGLV